MKMMYQQNNLILKRLYKKDTYTIGKLYLNGEYLCDTLEDVDRGLSSDMDINEIKSKKVYGETAIPTGTYKVTLNVVSPTLSKYQFYRDVCNSKVPRLLNVKGFEGILIHVGEGKNGHLLTNGCILVGKNTIKGGLTNSREMFKMLYNKLKDGSGDITLEIQ